MAEKYMALDEFKQFGYLQEVNRQFLHPLGLALEVAVAEDGTETLGGIWDYRDDPEGINYGDGVDTDKVERVGMEFINRAPAREAALGYIIQPYERKPREVIEVSQCDHCLLMTRTTLVRTCAECGAPKHA